MKKKLKLLTAGLFIPLASSLSLSAYVFSERDKNEYKDGGHAFYNNEYYPYNIKQYNFSRWMENVNDNKILFDMSIPGTHRTGMDSGSGAAWFFNKGALRTQSLNIRDQLESGIRALDLRLDPDMVIKHGDAFSDITLSNALDRVTEFLTINPSEFVVIKVKEESTDVNDYSATEKASRNYNRILNLQKYRNFLFNADGADFDANHYTVRNLRGKIVIINDWHRFINHSRVGGFLYRDYISNDFSVQNRTDVWTDEKMNKFVNLVNRSDNYWRPNNSDQYLFLNYTAISWKNISNKPDNFAAAVNQRVNGWLNQHEDATKLGIVYMDFPGTSINQAIFKRNYFIDDQEIAKGVLGRIINSNEISIDDLIATENQLTIRGPLAGFNIVIKDGERILKQVAIPNDYRQNSKTIELDEELNENQNLTFSFYKTIEENQFYEARNYNEINKTKTVELSRHTTNVNALKEEISLYAKFYPKSLSSASQYLKNVYIPKLEEIKRPTEQNIAEYQSVKTSWRTLRNCLENLKNHYIEISSLISSFESEHFTNNSIFDEEVKAKVSQVLNNFLSMVNHDFNMTNIASDVNFDKYQLMIANISAALRKIEEVKGVAQNIINGNELHDFETIFTDFDYGKTYWLNHVNTLNNNFLVVVKEILKKAESNVAITEFPNANEYMEQIAKLAEAKTFLQSEVGNIKEKIQEVNIGNKISHYESLITNNIQSLTSSQIILDELTNFKAKLAEAKGYIDNVDEFLESNNNNRNDELKNAYVDAIRQLEGKINDNVNIIDYKTLLIELENIKDLQNNIIAGNDFVRSRLYIIESLAELFEGQKTIFKNEINTLPHDAYTEISNVVTKARSLNANVYVSNIKNLSFINETRKENLKNVFESSVDEATLSSLYNENKKINDFINELTLFLLTFENYNEYEGFKLLSDSRKEAFTNAYTNLGEALKTQVSYEDLKEKSDLLKTFEFIKDNELSKKLKETLATISNDNELLNFAKSQYVSRLKNNISNNDDLDNLISEYTEFKNNNNVNGIMSAYTSLNNIQQQDAIAKIESSTSLDKLEEIKNDIYLLNEAMQNAMAVKNQNQNYQNEDWYTQNSEEYKNDLNNSYNEFSQGLLSVGDDIAKINSLIDEFVHIINLAKQNHVDLMNSTEIVKLKEKFNENLQTLKDRINKFDIYYSEKQADIKLWNTQMKILADKISFTFETELADKYIAELSEITKNFESRKEELETKVNALNNEYIHKTEVVKDNINKYLKQFVGNLEYINALKNKYDDLMSNKIEVNNKVMLDNAVDELNNLIVQTEEETEQRADFEKKSKQIFFHAKNFDMLPSKVPDKNLLLQNKFETIDVNILNRKNIDASGKVEIDYEISNSKYKKSRHQTLVGFLHKDTSTKTESKKAKSNDYLKYGLIALFSTIGVGLLIGIPLIIRKIKMRSKK